MTIHTFLLILFIGSSIGFAYHIIRGGGLGRLVLYWFTAFSSFLLGHLLGEWLHWQFFRIGMLNLFPALLATSLSLLLTTVLIGPERKDPPRRRGRSRRDPEV
jgi:hypothetical protein